MSRRLQRLILISVRTKEKLDNSPGWANAAYRYSLHTIRFMLDSAFRTSRSPAHTLSFYPHKPIPMYTIWAVCKELGISCKSTTDGPMMFFADKTLCKSPTSKQSYTWINGRCRDIRKSTISKIYEDVFGTSLLVDPTTYEGRAVEKSETNGTHDGNIITCPIARRRRGKMYQRIVNNEVSGRMVEDLRVVIVGNDMPYVYRKRRCISDRFLNTNPEVDITSADEVFTHTERMKIRQYADRLGIDFGDLDVLRDKGSGEIFVVDVNTTSVAPPIGLPYEVRRECIRTIANAFERAFLLAPSHSARRHTTDLVASDSYNQNPEPALLHRK